MAVVDRNFHARDRTIHVFHGCLNPREPWLLARHRPVLVGNRKFHARHRTIYEKHGSFDVYDGTMDEKGRRFCLVDGSAGLFRGRLMQKDGEAYGMAGKDDALGWNGDAEGCRVCLCAVWLGVSCVGWVAVLRNPTIQGRTSRVSARPNKLLQRKSPPSIFSGFEVYYERDCLCRIVCNKLLSFAPKPRFNCCRTANYHR